MLLHIVTIFRKRDGQKNLMWPGQLAPEESRGLLDVFIVICYFPINTPEDAQAATAHRGVKTDCGSGSQRWAGCQGLFSSSHPIVAEAAQLLGRPPDFADACHDGCNGVILPIFSWKMVNNLFLWNVWYWLWNILIFNRNKSSQLWSEGVGHDNLTLIAVIVYLGDHYNDHSQYSWITVHYYFTKGTLTFILEDPNAL